MIKWLSVNLNGKPEFVYNTFLTVKYDKVHHTNFPDDHTFHFFNLYRNIDLSQIAPGESFHTSIARVE